MSKWETSSCAARISKCDMAWLRYSLRALAAITTALLVSCIDGREEIWLNADGSGRADIAYSLPAAAAKFQGGETGVRAMIGDFLSKTPALTSSACEVTTIGDRLLIRVSGAFKSISDFKQVSTDSSLDQLPSSATHLTGEVMAKREGLSFAFARTISAGKALPGALFMPKSQLEGRNLTYIAHLPIAATESNATRVEDDGRTLIWEFPLAQALRSPVTTRFKAPIPLFTRLVTATYCTVIFAVGTIVILKLRRRRSSSFEEFKWK